MPQSVNADSCHLCHIHDHAHGSTLLRTSPLRHSKSRSRGATDYHHNHHHHHHHNDSNHQRLHDSLHHHSHHHDPYHRTTDITKVPSALARLSERSHSLPGSRRNSVSRHDPVSVLPNGSAEDYVRGIRSSRNDLRGSHRSLDHNVPISTLIDSRPNGMHTGPDLLMETLPRVHNDSRHSTLSRVPSHLSMGRDAGHDYYLHVQQNRFKEEARKQRFNLQTVMLIGCYTLLFVVAVIVGVVVCHQNGWLGFGDSDSSTGANNGRGVVDGMTDNNGNNNGRDNIKRKRPPTKSQFPPGLDYDDSSDSILQNGGGNFGVRLNENSFFPPGDPSISGRPKSIDGSSSNIGNSFGVQTPGVDSSIFAQDNQNPRISNTNNQRITPGNGDILSSPESNNRNFQDNGRISNVQVSSIIPSLGNSIGSQSQNNAQPTLQNSHMISNQNIQRNLNPNSQITQGNLNPNSQITQGNLNPNSQITQGKLNPNSQITQGNLNPNSQITQGKLNPNSQITQGNLNPNSQITQGNLNPNSQITQGNLNPNSKGTLGNVNLSNQFSDAGINNAKNGMLSGDNMSHLNNREKSQSSEMNKDFMDVIVSQVIDRISSTIDISQTASDINKPKFNLSSSAINKNDASTDIMEMILNQNTQTNNNRQLAGQVISGINPVLPQILSNKNINHSNQNIAFSQKSETNRNTQILGQGNLGINQFQSQNLHNNVKNSNQVLSQNSQTTSNAPSNVGVNSFQSQTRGTSNLNLGVNPSQISSRKNNGVNTAHVVFQAREVKSPDATNSQVLGFQDVLNMMKKSNFLPKPIQTKSDHTDALLPNQNIVKSLHANVPSNRNIGISQNLPIVGNSGGSSSFNNQSPIGEISPQDVRNLLIEAIMRKKDDFNPNGEISLLNSGLISVSRSGKPALSESPSTTTHKSVLIAEKQDSARSLDQSNMPMRMNTLTVSRGKVISMRTLNSSGNTGIPNELLPKKNVVVHLTPGKNNENIATTTKPMFSINIRHNGTSTRVGRRGKSLKDSMSMFEKVFVDPTVEHNKAPKEVIRTWRRKDRSGTLSEGQIRKDGSFAFTNCRPASICRNNR